MKKLFTLSLCVLLTLSMVLSSCDFAALFDGEASETVTTTETPTTENTTPIENPPKETPVETDEECYERAIALLNEGKTEEAYALFSTVPNYEDAATYLSRFSFAYTTKTVFNNYSGYSKASSIEVNTYDQYGKPRQVLVINPENGSVDKHYYRYNANQNLVMVGFTSEYGEHDTWYGYDEENRVIYRLSDEGRSTVEYDAAGNVIKRFSEYTGTTIEYEYTSDGNLVKITYSNDEETTLIESHEYDANGQIIKITQELFPGQTIINYVYDENGNLLVRERIQDNGLNSRDEHEYDERGNRIKSTYHSAWDDTYSCYYWEYDEKGNVTKETHDLSDRSIDYVRSYKYDEAGNCIKVTYETRGDVYETFYFYDVYGNLLKSVTETITIEYSGWQLFYNPYPVMIDELDAFVGK